MMSNPFNDEGQASSRQVQQFAIRVVGLIALWTFCTANVVAQAPKEKFRSAGTVAEVSPTAPANSVRPLESKDFVIGADDVLWISVWKEPELSQQALVRSDGKISLPLVGDVQAAGQTTQQLQVAVTEKLKNYIASPMVTIVVREARSQSFNVLGQVEKPGVYPLDKATTVLDSLARAGGFREWAKVRSIYVLRRQPDGSTVRIPFDYKKAVRGSGGDFELQTRDTIVVP